jgi:dephospho-CoA kinase
MDVIGLTGGIASGKSTVAGMLRDLGATVIDADEASRAVVEPGTPGLAAIVEAFGPEILDGGRLDRWKLGAIIFEDQAARRRLEAITHPLIRAWMAERQQEAADRGEERVVVDIPLLYENGLDRGLEAVIVVYAPAEVEMERLMARNGFSRTEAEQRLAAQLPIEEKKARATYVIDNSGSREQTREQVRRLWNQIAQATP